MLLEKHEYIEFYVGKNGEFDEPAASAVRRLKSELSAFCSLTLVLPYEIANLDLIEKSYDEVICQTIINVIIKPLSRKETDGLQKIAI